MRQKLKKGWDQIQNDSLLLILGTLAALFWANTSPENYKVFHHMVILNDFFIGESHIAADGLVHRTLTLHYLVNDLLMSVFFFIAGKEIFEAIALPNGSLKGKKAVVPLIATVGGMFGPVIVYLIGAYLFGDGVYDQVKNGWAVPTATDIAFSFLVARIIFGRTHPAVSFLLLVAIADDAGGLIILATFYPTEQIQPLWLMLSFTVSVLAYWLPRWLGLVKNKQRYSTFVRAIPYIVAGAISWYAFMRAGIHPALGLLPVIPAIPHAANDTIVFDPNDVNKKDMLNILQHRLEGFVKIVLGLFGLLNAGVEFSVIGPATWLVFSALLIGKPIGILLMGFFGAKLLKFGLPEGMSFKDLFLVGVIAAIGFTVSLFVASVAFPVGSIQDAAKMGAVFSFSAAGLAFTVAWFWKIKPIRD